MPTANQMIQFRYGLQEKYDGLAAKDSNTIYFTSDKQRLFVGDVEYTRPVGHGSALPSQFLPPDSLFVVESGSRRELYYSKDGAAWELVSVLPAEITAGVVGANTAGTVKFGSTIKIPKVTYDKHGNITAAQDVSITLPKETPVELGVFTSGDGNVVTSISTTGSDIEVTKGETFAKQQDLEAVQSTANSKVTANGDITAGTHTKITYDAKGLVTGGSDLTASDIPNLAAGKITSGTFDVARIPDITLSKVTDAGAAAAKGVATNISTGTDLPTAGAVKSYVDSAISGVSQFKYQVVTELPTASKSTMGTIYLVAHTHTTGDGYDEYLTIESGTTTKTYAWEKIGNTDIDLSAYAKSADVTKEIDDDIAAHVTANHKTLTVGSKTYNGSAAVTIAKGDLGLGNVDNTADANKPVSTAQATAIADAKKAGTDAQSTINTHAADTTVHITAAERTTWNGKQDALNFNTAYDASTNKVATMADVTAAVLVWGTI